MFKSALVILALLAQAHVYAHEGHNQVPGQLKINHGGKVEAGKEINLEWVSAGTEVTLFPASHEGKDLKAAEVTLTATAKLPKGKPEPVKLDIKDGAYTAKVDFKSGYRVEMNITADHNGKQSTFKIQIEK